MQAPLQLIADDRRRRCRRCRTTAWLTLALLLAIGVASISGAIGALLFHGMILPLFPT